MAVLRYFNEVYADSVKSDIVQPAGEPQVKVRHNAIMKMLSLYLTETVVGADA